MGSVTNPGRLLSGSKWSRPRQPQAVDQFRNYGSSRAQAAATAGPSPIASAGGSFAIDFVVSRMASIALGTVLVGVLLADRGSVDDVNRHLNVGAIAVTIACTAIGAIVAGSWLSRRKVARPFLAAGAGAASGAVVQTFFNFAASDAAGSMGLVLASVVEFTVTYALIRSASRR